MRRPFPHHPQSPFSPDYVSQIPAGKPPANKAPAPLKQPTINIRATLARPSEEAKKFRQYKASI